MVKRYDPISTMMYALGRAIEEEDDPVVKAQMEDLEERMTVKLRERSEAIVKEILSR
jgi:hypothetical protein